MTSSASEVSERLYELATLLELNGENGFKVRAYEHAARQLEASGVDLAALVSTENPTIVKGIGKGILEKIREYLDTGEIALLTELRNRTPPGIVAMLRIQGLGPKKIRALSLQLSVQTLDELESACRSGAVAELKGFGDRIATKILKGIEFVRSVSDLYLYPEAIAWSELVLKRFRSIPGVLSMTVCGSVRRAKEAVRDIDMVIIRTPDRKGRELHSTIEDLLKDEERIATGETKISFRFPRGPQVDLRLFEADEAASATLHFTGSKEHNTRLRSRAKERGLKLNEYGLFEESRRLNTTSEAEIYQALGLKFIPPELREDFGEIEAGARGFLPRLVEWKDIRGVFHLHTTASDGTHTLPEMVARAQSLGLSYLGVTDHSQSARYARGLSLDDLKRQWDEVDALNAKLSNFRIFKGIESDILPDGSLDYDDATLSQFDFVIGSLHSHFTLSRAEQTKRVLRAIENPFLTMLGHLTARLIGQRQPVELEIDPIIQSAAAHSVLIEFNCNPSRMDLDWRELSKAIRAGVMTSINPDAHSAEGVSDMKSGVAVARKAWLEPKDVLNTHTADEVERILRRRRP